MCVGKREKPNQTDHPNKKKKLTHTCVEVIFYLVSILFIKRQTQHRCVYVCRLRESRLLYPYDKHMDLSGVLFVCQAGWQARLVILCGKTFSIEQYMQTFPTIFIPARLVGTIDLYHLIPLTMTVNLAGVTRSEQSLLAPIHFWHTFQVVRMKFGMVLKQFKLNILMLFLSEI